MTTGITAEEVIAALRLQPHPVEGGFFRETYRSVATLPQSVLPKNVGDRSLCTAIYYLLTPQTVSAIHQLPTDEVFHFYLGDPVEMIQLWPGGTSRQLVLGTDIRAGHLPQTVVPGGVWQGSFLVPGGKFALLGATMAPGFDYLDYASGNREELQQIYPEVAELIEKLTPRPSDRERYMLVLGSFGDRERFAIELGQVIPGESPSGLREVRLWAAGRLLTGDGVHADMPQFCASMESTITWLLSETGLELPYPESSFEDNHRKVDESPFRASHRFLAWGPATDNVRAFYFRQGADAVITFEFGRESHPNPIESGEVFSVKFTEREFLLTLHQATSSLRSTFAWEKNIE